MKASETATSPAKTLLWQKVLDRKQFYAFEFVKDFDIGAYTWDFVCVELRWIVHITPDSIDQSVRRSLLEENYKLTTLHPYEVQNEFSHVEGLLSEMLKDIVGRPCGE